MRQSNFIKFRQNCRVGVSDYGEPKRRQLAIPDQTLSLREIVKRYVRGVPVDVIQREGVYIDQTEFDLEKLNRMEFSEKMSVAEELRNRYDSLMQRAEERREQLAKDESDAKDERIRELEAQAKGQKKDSPESASIVDT